MKLFCFPYAGGSSVIFNQWKNYFESDIEIRAIELAGRGKRIHEPLYKNFKEVIDDIYSLINEEIRESEYAFFGHSMGAKISYELTQRILEKGLSGPEHIFFSGRGAPYVIGENEKDYRNLTDNEFKKAVLNLGGTPKEFFEHPELLEVFLPLLKNDFVLASREPAGKEINLLPCDITVFIGKDEDLSSTQIDSWKYYTSGNCTIHYYNGGHFFINEKIEKVVNQVKSTLQSIRRFMNTY